MKNRIMVIDDDKEFLEEIRESLVLSDYEVVTVANPSDAIEEVIRTKPDLILLDIKMPEESGFQVACKIKYFSALRSIPIIAVTGYLNQRHRASIKGYGIRSYLTKPLDPVNLVLEIERAL